jgi:hypothetical protein
MKLKIIFLLIFIASSCNSKKYIINNVLRDKNQWVIEQQPGGIVTFKKNKIEITDANGCTIWLKKKLHGNIKIEYDVTVIDKGGSRDRVSDNNCFWMATDPSSPNDFFKNSANRTGKFYDYNKLELYYVGNGGHDNSKTRFRRYDGNFERPLLPEHDLSDKKFLIIANKKIHVEIIVNNNVISYSLNGDLVFLIDDPKPYTEGHFGFRTVNNHMIIQNFRVKKI